MNRAYTNGLKVVVQQKAGPFLLDLFPDADAAFSLRRLRTDYTGAAIRVRRSSDNAEQDIGFRVNGDLNTSALLAFVGSGDGLVTKLYKQDESSFSIDLSQTDFQDQPYIVIGGQLVVNPDNGLPAIRATRDFDSGSDHKLVGSQGMADNFNYQNGSVFSVTKSLISGRNTAYGWTASFNTNLRVGLGIDNNGNLIFRNNTEGRFGNDSVTAQTALFYQRGGTGTVNNLSPNLTTGGDASSLPTPFALLKFSTVACEHLFQEIVLWNFNQDANRDDIVSHVNTYYNVY